MTDFVRAFNNDHNNISDAVNAVVFHTSQNPPQVSVKTFYAN